MNKKLLMVFVLLAGLSSGCRCTDGYYTYGNYQTYNSGYSTNYAGYTRYYPCGRECCGSKAKKCACSSECPCWKSSAHQPEGSR